MVPFDALAEETQPPTQDVPVRVRSLRMRDWRVVTRLLTSTFEDLDPDRLARELRNAPHHFAVAVTAAGVTGVMRLAVDLGTRRTEIDLLAVADAARGRGVARAMLRYAEEVAQACGTPHLKLAVDPGNVAARALLGSVGWVAAKPGPRRDAERVVWQHQAPSVALPDWRLRRAHAPQAPMGWFGRTARRALYGVCLAAA